MTTHAGTPWKYKTIQLLNIFGVLASVLLIASISIEAFSNAAFVGDSKISGWNTKFDKQSYETFNSCLKVNLTSIFLLTKELRKLLNNSNNPSIVNISSIYSFLAPDYNLYKGTNI